jgi:hypothetical protein
MKARVEKTINRKCKYCGNKSRCYEYQHSWFKRHFGKGCKHFTI